MTSTLIFGGRIVSGQPEPRGGLDRSDQPDALDRTLDLSGLISRLNNGTHNNGSLANGDNGHGNSRPDNGGVTGNADVKGIGDTAPSARPARRPSVANGQGALAAYAPPERPEVTAEPEGSAPTPAAAAERLVPGSLADLRQRLERLPYGHPSSPYHVDGERKPPPPRLKHLELAPPAPSRSAGAPSQPPVVDDDPIAAAAPSTPVAADPGDPQDSGPAPMLTEDQLRIADDAYDRFRAAEGRNLFGSYGSTGLTVVLRDVAARLEYGELAPDAEQNSLLEPDAFRGRFAAMLARYPDRAAELLARRIPGAISYSFIFDGERYSAGTWMVQDTLTGMGFQLLARRNDWSSPVNRCVATMWHDPTSGLPFEVQFHTSASLEAKQLARSSATLINDPRIPSAESANLRSDLAAAWAALPAPHGHGQIGEYRRDGAQPPSTASG